MLRLLMETLRVVWVLAVGKQERTRMMRNSRWVSELLLLLTI